MSGSSQGIGVSLRQADEETRPSSEHEIHPVSRHGSSSRTFEQPEMHPSPNQKTPPDTARPASVAPTVGSMEHLQYRPADLVQEQKHVLKDGITAGDGWNFCRQYVKKFDDEMIKDIRDELSNLLIFTGLFSAVVTAFCIESFGMLQEDPQDRTVDLLTQISAQLAGFPAGPAPLPNAPPSPFQPPSTSVVINTLWFLSLSLTLVAALLAILVLQWLQHYQFFPLISSQHKLHLRQQRFDALQQWRVRGISSALSVMLQVALFLFLIGVSVLLWTLHRLTAYIVTPAIALMIAVPTVMTIIPTFNEHCPYKSPLAWTIRNFLAIMGALLLPVLWVFTGLGAIIIGMCCGPYGTVFKALDRAEDHLRKSLHHQRNRGWSARNWWDREMRTIRSIERPRLYILTWVARTWMIDSEWGQATAPIERLRGCFLDHDNGNPLLELSEWTARLAEVPDEDIPGWDRTRLLYEQAYVESMLETARRELPLSITLDLVRRAQTRLQGTYPSLEALVGNFGKDPSPFGPAAELLALMKVWHIWPWEHFELVTVFIWVLAAFQHPGFLPENEEAKDYAPQVLADRAVYIYDRYQIKQKASRELLFMKKWLAAVIPTLSRILEQPIPDNSSTPNNLDESRARTRLVKSRQSTLRILPRALEICASELSINGICSHVAQTMDTLVQAKMDGSEFSNCWMMVFEDILQRPLSEIEPSGTDTTGLESHNIKSLMTNYLPDVHALWTADQWKDIFTKPQYQHLRNYIDGHPAQLIWVPPQYRSQNREVDNGTYLQPVHTVVGSSRGSFLRVTNLPIYFASVDFPMPEPDIGQGLSGALGIAVGHDSTVWRIGQGPIAGTSSAPQALPEQGAVGRESRQGNADFSNEAT